YGPSGPGFAVLEVSVADCSSRSIRSESMGSLELVATCHGDKDLVTVDASNTLLIYRDGDRSRLELLQRREVFGGFIKHAAMSPDHRFVAVSSQNEINSRSGPPRKLTIFDLDGKAEATSSFDSNLEYVGSTFAFARDSKELLLYVPNKPVQSFKLDEKRQVWTQASLNMRPAKFIGVASCIDDNGTLYVGSNHRTFKGVSDNRIYELVRDGERLELVASLTVGPSTGYPNDGIQNLIWVPGPPMLVAALHDGRLAVVRLPTQ
ncbi:MAG: hypothetical protein HQ559_02490, partial [Lentisphaerae bacterium]|nr:hypothetical protein [Lentisphaerota bacterium]